MAATAGVVLPSPAFAQSVSDDALADLQVQKVGDCTNLTITFNTRVQLQGYFPDLAGRELHVRVQPLDSTAIGLGSDSLRTPASVPELRSVSYEGSSAGGPILSLFFTRDTAFKVEAGALPTQLVISLSAPEKAGTCAVSNQALPAGVGAGAGPGQGGAAMAQAPSGSYVINLSSTPGAVPPVSETQAQALTGRVLYETQFERDSQTWHRLRLGFFDSREQADAARKQLLGAYPEAWVVKITPAEREQAITAPLALAGPATAAPTASAPPVAMVGSEADAAETARLIGEAEGAIKDNNSDRAIQLLTNAAQKPENANTARAIELLGLAREKKGQNAHARAQYEEYLRRYPSGEGTDRVRQRLAALDGSGSGGGPLRQASGIAAGGAGKWKWGLRGSVSQFYFRDQGRTSTLTTSSTLGDEVDNSVNVNQLLTTGDVTISGGNDRRMFQIRAAGSYTKNFGTSTSITTIDNGTETQTFRSKPGGGIGSISALYFDYSDNDLNTQLRIGRQTRNSQGVLGRFDGALLGFQANPHLRLNAVAGFPVLSSRQTYVNTDRAFYGASVDFGAKRSPVQFTLYWFDQHARGGFIDRRSVGIESRLLKKNFNAYAMLDYDVKFGQLNLGLLTLNYNFPDTSSLSLTADYRRSPLLTTTNALIGQFDTINSVPFTSLAGLKPFFTDDQIYRMAQDRTLIAKSLTLTYSRPITRKLQLSTDFTLTDTGGTPGTAATAGTPEIQAMPAIGKEYYYGVQLIGSDLLMGSDIYILSGRYADTATARIYTADFNARLPITKSFRLSPRLRYGFRDNKPAGAVANPGTFKQFQPTVRLNYYPIKNSEIEIEFGGNFTRQTMWNSTTSAYDRVNEKGWVLSAGYRLDF
ncbi:SPOR domain-containing protein [Novosphingobium sp.]|uniref:SPOR domain-containing protein n=1 Tax=Novosphingobium sp. TaxID=1874826 RepID=UPI0025E2032A|nr:SPOR domain-containing protein [Novosphingobium sp.]MCC6926820.1 SPOR domain-containing protein [Novosphingobium sp.]